jgi:DNA mismatch repair protein MutL
MQDIIQLLPDSVANQIAAGEVIQRPASVVKELLENAIDAGAEKITLLVQEAGRELIQVSDNGRGMSPADARMCFERHATSKLKGSEDLFRIQTKGFRGEALASIAAVAQVELKTRRFEEQLGTQMLMAGSKVVEQNLTACAPGTVFSVKKLFYNIPARYAFLKSNAAENTHISEEFIRVAIAHPEVAFTYNSNGNEQYHLVKSNLPQRIAALFGNNYQDRLVKLEEQTQVVNIRGYVVKPEFSRKTRGEQYFFVNNRFIRNPYLNNAVQMAFHSLIPHENQAGYFIFIDVDPAAVDVNIHPTKTEVKFRDEKVIYAILHAVVKRSLGQANLTPSLDFTDAQSVEFPLPEKGRIFSAPEVKINPGYNPFDKTSGSSFDMRRAADLSQWHQLYAPDHASQQIGNPDQQSFIASNKEEEKEEYKQLFQVANQYIVLMKNGTLYVVDQQFAHEQVLFERFVAGLAQRNASSQQLMFPEHVEVQPHLQPLLKELLPDLRELGFLLQPLGIHTWVVSGIPSDAINQNLQQLLDDMLNAFNESRQDLSSRKQTLLCASLARKLCIKRGMEMKTDEIQSLAKDFLACENTRHTPSGKKIMTKLSPGQLGELIKNQT